MRKSLIKQSWLLLLALGAVIAAGTSVQAQAGATGQQPPQPETQQAPPTDPIRDLNLSPEQLAKVRAIRLQNREERAAINLRVKTSRKALDEALDSDNPSDELIELRAHELGEAQAAQIRMQAIIEVKIHRVLTLEQIARLREIRLLAQRGREKRMENQGNRRPLPNQRNGVAPLNRRPPNQ